MGLIPFVRLPSAALLVVGVGDVKTDLGKLLFWARVGDMTLVTCSRLCRVLLCRLQKQSSLSC